MMTKSVKLGRLGPHEIKLLFTLESEKKKIFGFQDALAILKIPQHSVANVLYRLKKKRRITEIEKGKYVLSPAVSGVEGYWAEEPYLIVKYLVTPYYVGFWSGLHYWGLTEQIPRTLFVATTKRKKTVEYITQKIKFITLTDKMFFDYTEERVNGETFSISSREKTIVDSLLYPQYSGGLYEVTKAIWSGRKELNWNRILEIIDIINVDSVRGRLGYILEILSLKKEVRKHLSKKKIKGFRWLDPSAKKDIKFYSKVWGLKINVDTKHLLGWRGY